MQAWLRAALGALALCASPALADDADADPAPFMAGTHFRFVEADEARAFLAEHDAFVDALSEADMQLRFGVPAADYAARAAAAAMSWTPDEVADMKATIALLRARFEAARIVLPLPEEVLLLRTDGSEEGNAGGYTRSNAIIYTGPGVELAPERLVGGLAHELFHVASRFRPAIRDDLYAIIGFEPCAPLVFPAGLVERRVTDPDAYHYDHCIPIRRDGETLSTIPILLLKPPPAGTQPTSLFDLLDVELIAVGPDGAAVTDAGGAPLLTPLAEAADYARAIGGNTGYVINPEEIMADNVKLLADPADDVPNPEILEQARAVLSSD